MNKINQESVKEALITELKKLNKELKNCSQSIYGIYELSSQIVGGEEITNGITDIEAKEYFAVMRGARRSIAAMIRRFEEEEQE